MSYELTGFDVEAQRRRFPALERESAGRAAIFADAPGGTQVPLSVIEAVAGYLSGSNANRGGFFETSRETDALIDEARRAAADLLGCELGESVFGANMTTLAFSLSRVLANELRRDEEVVVTSLDHDANIAPWLAAAEGSGATVRWVGLTEDCRLDLEALDAVLSDRTRIVAFPLASNAVGTVTDAREIVATVRARAHDALVIADAVHFAPHRMIDVKALDLDVLFCSPYKFFGPHMGVMYARRRLLDGWRPYKVRPSSDVSPDRWETGTANHEGIAGFVACVEHIASIAEGDGSRRERLGRSMVVTQVHEERLTSAFLEGLRRLDTVTLYGPGAPGRTPTFALRVRGQHPDETARRLADDGIFVWSGNYYALAVMEALDLEKDGGAVRIGFCNYSTLEEVERTLDALERIAST